MSQPTVESITFIISEYYQTTTDTIRGRSLKREDVLIRQVAFYFSAYYTNSSLKAIGEYFDHRDHSTVINGRDKINGFESAKDPINREIWLRVKEIEVLIRNQMPRKVVINATITSGIYKI